VKRYTLADLEAMTPNDRANLYENARKKIDEGGKAIIDLIDSSGLPLSAGGMRASDPVYLEMETIIWSPEGRQLALSATSAGLPALAGIEPSLVSALGQRYHPHDGGTVNAGYLVAGLMRHMGFVEAGEGKMPPGSVAKTAMKWRPRKS
jgi:hypothetical protein